MYVRMFYINFNIRVCANSYLENDDYRRTQPLSIKIMVGKITSSRVRSSLLHYRGLLSTLKAYTPYQLVNSF